MGESEMGEPPAARRVSDPIRGKSPPATDANWSWLMIHPVFWVAVVVLVVNDRVLKRSFPGLLTGKLSDIAGVVMVAVVLVAVSGRIRASLGLTAALFGLLKTVPIVAVWSIPVLGGRTRTDPTDLVALIALVPLGLWLWHRRDRSVASAPSDPVRVWVMAAKIGGLGVAMLATSATSCFPDPFGGLGVTPDGTIVAGSVDGGADTYLVLPVRSNPTTSDGDYLAWESYAGAAPDDMATVQSTACTTDGTCVEIRDLTIVEISPGGAETVVLDYNDKRDAIDSQSGSCSEPIGSEFRDVVTNGSVVVVAMGPVGAMVRTAEGEWLPTGTTGNVPSLAEQARFRRLLTAFAWTWPLLALVAAILFLSLYPTRVAARVIGIVLAVLFWLFTMFVLMVWLGFLEADPRTGAGLAVVGSFVIVAVSLALGLLARKRPPEPPDPRVPYRGWN